MEKHEGAPLGVDASIRSERELAKELVDAAWAFVGEFILLGGPVRARDTLMALLAVHRASVVAGLLGSVESLARQAAREESFFLLRAPRIARGGWTGPRQVAVMAGLRRVLSEHPWPRPERALAVGVDIELNGQGTEPVTPTEMVLALAQLVASGEAECARVAGGEAGFWLAIVGEEPEAVTQRTAPPPPMPPASSEVEALDEVLRPQGRKVSSLELEACFEVCPQGMMAAGELCWHRGKHLAHEALVGGGEPKAGALRHGSCWSTTDSANREAFSLSGLFPVPTTAPEGVQSLSALLTACGVEHGTLDPTAPDRIEQAVAARAAREHYGDVFATIEHDARVQAPTVEA